MSIVYADELFALNAAIDYFLLRITAQLCDHPARRGRWALTAAGGAAWCCLGLLPELAWLDGPWMKAVLALGMCLGAFGRERRLWRSAAVFFALSFLFGGAVWALGLWRGTAPGGGRLMKLDMRVLSGSFALCWAGVSLVFRRIAKSAERHIVSVTLTHRGRSVTLRALEDTGNELRDPVSGRRVLVTDADTLAPLFSPTEAAALHADPISALPRLKGFCLLPYSALDGGGLLLCFRPDGAQVDGKDGALAVAVSPKPLCPEGDYDAIF